MPCLPIQSLEAAIWEQWTIVSEPEQRQLMMRGIAEMQQHELKTSVETFTRLIDIAPDLSEAWNKRATAYWLLGNFPASLSDICETIKREPRHFGAYSGLGMIRAEMGEYPRAVAAFELARKYNPHIVGIDDEIDRLKAMGLISEIITWKLRLFVPTGTTGPAILAELMERYPVILVADRAA